MTDTHKTHADYPHLTAWIHPSHYFGATWEGWYSVIGRSRDSDALERANFDAMVAELQALPDAPIDLGECGPDNDGASVQVIHESHWAVGWVEWLGVHSSNVKALELAERLKAKLEDYPVLDEDLFSQYEDEGCGQVWENCMNETERVEYLRKHVSKVYPMPGMTAYAMLRAAVKGDWYYAGNLLPCPSDLIA